MMEYIREFFFSGGNNELVFSVIDAVCFLFFAVGVLYLFVFAIKSTGKPRNIYPKAKKKYRYAVVFPAYKEDRVILGSVENFLEQTFPRENYDVFVVSDGMADETNAELERMSAIVIRPEFTLSTKTNALQQAITYIDNHDLHYDNIVILDADNSVDDDFLDNLNDAFYSGCSAIQTHRVAKQCNTNVAVLDAVSEEINNSIFRKGHTRMGFSSSLIGSGMAFDYKLFKKCIMKSSHVGVDKQLERYLLRNNYYIEYLPEVYTYDEKVSKGKQFYKQRKRWVSTQFSHFFRGIWGCPKAALEGNWDYCNKLLQWAMPPRVILIGFIGIISVVLTVVGLPFLLWSIKWWCLLLLMIITLALAIPDYLFNAKLLKAMFSIPWLFLLMLLNTFAIFNRSNEFIHTEHYEVDSEEPKHN
jgi:cellulose synthase/poly-beta-1,6-N-acetylglucosamine synthase-like glycosyltransferase